MTSPGFLGGQITTNRLQRVTWIVILATVGIIIYWGFSRAPQNAFDDAYITYRYADNFRQGLGLLYNPGEWVFGTTTPLFTLLLGFIGLAISDIELAAHWLGVIGWITAALLTIPLFRQENRPLAALVAPVLIVVQPTFYTSLGMETPLLVTLMLAVALFWLRGSNKIAVILSALLILTRHDSVLWLLIIGLEIGRRRHKSGENWPQSIPWREGLVTVALTLPWFIYAWLRYGSPLPNSAAAKIGQNTFMPVEGQSPFAIALLNTFLHQLPVLISILIIILFIISIYLIIGRQHRFWWLLAWPILYVLFYTLINVANFPWYFVPPVTIFLLVISLAFGSLLGDAGWKTGHSTSILPAPAILQGITLVSLIFLISNLAVITANRQDSPGYRPSYLSAAEWLSENAPPEAAIATIEIGVIGYHSKRPILDTQGLVSRDMTSHQLGWDDTLVYALNAHQPDYALALPGTAWDIVTAQWWFQLAYKPVQQFSEATLYGRINPLVDPVTIPIDNPDQSSIKLESLTLSTTEIKPGQHLTASLAISILESPLPPLRFITYLVDTGSYIRYGITDTDPFENLYPSQHWQTGDRLNIPLRMTIPAELPAGAYNFGIILNDTAEGKPFLQSIPAGEIHLGLLRFGPPLADTLQSQSVLILNQSWANGITLRQLSYPESPIRPGSNLELQLSWDTTAQPGRDWTFFVHLINNEDEIISQKDQRPWGGRWPTTAWRPNEPFLENISLEIPPDLPAGSYSLRLGFYILDERLPLNNSTIDFLMLPEVLEIEP